MDLNVVLGRY